MSNDDAKSSGEAERSQNDTLSQKARSGIGRRGFLAATSASLTAALAGCSGGGDGGEAAEDATPTETTETNGGGGANAVSLKYWGIANVQSSAARARVEEIVSRFEKSTGASVEINHSGYKQLQGSKWIQAFERGNQPPVFDTETTYMGRFYENDYIVPYNEYKADLDSKVNDDISWIFDTYSKAMEGWEAEAYDIPWGFLPRNAMQVRADHMEEAGLDPESDFPPKNMDELKSLAKTLDEDGPGEHGFQMFGAIYDWMDTFQPMIASRDPEKAEFLTSDWEDVNFDSDAYINTISDAMEIYRDMGIGSPSTPTISDEKARDLMLQGRASMSSFEWANIPTVLDRRPELMKSGDLRWGPFFGSDSSAAVMGYFSTGLSRKPENVDQKKWQRKRKASTEMINLWLSDWNQTTSINKLGLLPANNSVWEDASLPGEENHHALETAFTMAENSEAVWESHPAIATIKDKMAGPAIQDIYKGANVEDRMTKLAENARAEL